jgi:putative endonuclease
MKPVRYVYILRSISQPDKLYVGLTENLERRLAEHNSGSQIYSRRYAPWEMVTYVAFSDPTVAADFEKYLKTPSGKALCRKRLTNLT